MTEWEIIVTVRRDKETITAKMKWKRFVIDICHKGRFLAFRKSGDLNEAETATCVEELKVISTWCK